MFGRIPACGWRLEPQDAAARFCFGVRRGENRGWWSGVSGRAQGTVVVPPWLASDGRGSGGRPVFWVLREEEGEEEKQRRERGSSALS